MTFAKSKNRSKTIIHADMIYDSICHTGRTTHKNLGYYDYLKLLRGGNAGSKRFYDVGVGDSGHTYAGAYDENGGYGQYATDYPLPLHVSFVFGNKVPNDHTSYIGGGRRFHDSLYNEVHNYLGCLVIRTYRGISHFIPGNMESFNTKPIRGPISDEPDMFLDSDLWANFLKSFTVKLSIPKKVPSLVFKKDNGDYKFTNVHSGELKDFAYIDETTSKRISLLQDENGKYMADPIGGAGRNIGLTGTTPKIIALKFPAPAETTPTITIDFPGAGSFDSVQVSR